MDCYTMKSILISTLFCLVQLSNGEDECEEIMVPMCKGLVGYTHTKFPNSLGHQNQKRAYRFLEPLWPSMDKGCSNNLRLLACGMAVPKCTQKGNTTEIELPCRETCFWSKKGCQKDMKKNGLKWPRKLKCSKLRRKKQKKCLKPHQRLRRRKPPMYSYCQPTTFPMCQNLTFTIGTLPNMFLQDKESEILTEIEQYRPLAETQCHEDLWFLICGIFRPYCIASNPFTVPCRELCEDVRSKCEKPYRKLYKGLRWPAKLQCHRYPKASAAHTCVMPTDTELAKTNF